MEARLINRIFAALGALFSSPPYCKDIRNRVTIAEAEAKHMVQCEKLGTDPVPFGFNNSRWRDLLSQMQEGDEIWEFSSSPECWNNLTGRAGIELIRNGKSVTLIINRKN